MIDWNGKLEAVHDDGRVLPLTIREQVYDGDKLTNEWVDGVAVWKEDGAAWARKNFPWHVRNATHTPDERAVAPELVERMRMIFKRLSDNRYTGFEWHEDAVEIVAALEPVDPMLLEARKIVADQYGESGNVAHLREQALSGDGDEWFHTKVALAALRRGRSLATSRDVTPCTREQFEEDCRA